MKRLWPCVLLALSTSALAQSDSAEARITQERKLLQAERLAVEQTHDALNQGCWQRFAVNDCLREVRRSRYAALDPIRARELELNAQERALRTHQRDERLREKSQEGRP